jgi:hypothetical protein
MVFILAGSFASVIISQLVTKALMIRGYQKLGFILGLLAMVIFLGLGQLFIAQDYRSFFSENGHCGTCCELCGITFVIWWFLWGVGFIIYLLLGVGFARQFSKIPQRSVPQRLRVYFLGGVLCIIFGVIGINWARDYLEHFNVRNNLVEVENPIRAGNIRIIGSIMLPQSARDLAFGSMAEVEKIQISPNGEWFTLQYADKMEIWKMPDIVLKKSFYSDTVFWDSISAFSPDGSRLAVWLHGDIFVYSLVDDSINLLWKIEGKSYGTADLGFSMDGSELVLVNIMQGYHVDVFSADSGSLVSTLPLPSQDGFSIRKLSNNSEYMITDNEKVVQIYDRHSGQLLHELEQTQRGSFLPNNDVLFWNCDQAIGEVWVIETDNKEPFETDYECLDPFETIAFSPDSNLFIYADLHDMLIWDLQNKEKISHVFMKSGISAIAMTPDQKTIIIATTDGRLNFLANFESSD